MQARAKWADIPNALRSTGYSLVSRTPLACPAIALALGIHYSPHLDLIMALGVGGLFVFMWCVYAQLWGYHHPYCRTVGSYLVILGIITLFGVGLRHVEDRRLGLDMQALPRTIRLVSYSSGDEVRLTARLLDGEVAGKLVLLKLSGGNSIGVGDTLEVVRSSDSTYAQRPLLTHDLAKGITARLSGYCVGHYPLCSARELIRYPRLLARYLQVKLVERIETLLGKGSRKGRLVSAIALGYLPSGGETRELRQSFARSGVAHVLAVSGFHLGIIASLLSLLLSGLCRLSRSGWSYLVCMLLGVWGFTLISGWAVPTVRASLMLSLYLIGKRLGRSPRLPNILAAAALTQLLVSPYELYSIGFGLSYAAVLSIYMLYAPLCESVGSLKNPLLKWPWQAFCLSLSAQVLVLPLCLYYWGASSLAFVWSSVPMTLLAVLLLPLSWLLLGLSALPLSLGPVAEVLSFLAEGMLRLSDYLGSLSYTMLSIEGRIPWLLALYVLLLPLSWLIHQGHERRVAERIL